MMASSENSILPATTTFKREADMLSPLRDHADVVLAGTSARTAVAPSDSARNSWRVLFEVQTMNGIVDMLYVRFDHACLQLRQTEGRQPITNWNEVLVFAVLQASAQPLTMAELAAKTGLTPSGLKRGPLARLESSGHVASMAKAEAPAPLWKYRLPVTRLVAVEAKRSDWRQAAAQASRHTTFADGSFLAVQPVAGQRALEQEKIVSRSQLGVLSVDPTTNTVERLASAPYPSQQRRRALSRMFVAEQAMHVIWHGGVSGPVQPVFGQMLTTSRGPDPRFSPRASV